MKKTLIILSVVIAVILLFIGLFAGKNNTAIKYEEEIKDSKSAISVREQRRQTLYTTLVDALLNYDKYESSTMEAVIQARQSVVEGNYEAADKSINIVFERYPELKSITNYDNFNKNVTTTENELARYRENYNTQIKRYNRYIRTFPNNIILGILGYEPIKENYLEYETTVDGPTNLFNSKGE